MPLHTVTLTGVDEYTSLDDVQVLAGTYPYAEFGVLWDREFAGKHNRYPNLDFIADLATQKQTKQMRARMALHICGLEAIGEFIENARSMTATLARCFDRLQLNYDPSEAGLPMLDSAIARHPNQTIITQHGANLNRSHWRSITSPNHAVLFDSSQGAGKLAEEWPTALADRRNKCGWAGGIGPDNIEQQLPLIDDAALGQRYWIDMESSLRSASDRFDLKRSEIVLEKARPWMLAR